MKTREDFPDALKFARYLHEKHNLPKWFNVDTIAQRIRNNITDEQELIKLPMTRTAQGKKGKKKALRNLYNPHYL